MNLAYLRKLGIGIREFVLRAHLWSSDRILASHAVGRDAIPGLDMPKTQDMAHATSLLSIQHFGIEHGS